MTATTTTDTTGTSTTTTTLLKKQFNSLAKTFAIALHACQILEENIKNPKRINRTSWKHCHSVVSLIWKTGNQPASQKKPRRSRVYFLLRKMTDLPGEQRSDMSHEGFHTATTKEWLEDKKFETCSKKQKVHNLSAISLSMKWSMNLIKTMNNQHGPYSRNIVRSVTIMQDFLTVNFILITIVIQ